MSPLHETLGDGDAGTVPFGPVPARVSNSSADGPAIVVCSLMRHSGDTGVQTYVRTVEDQLEGRGRPYRFVNPFTRRSALRSLVFAARYAIRPFSPRRGVGWYRRWHAWYLERALRSALRGLPSDSVLFAQCPVSADVALRVRTTQPVVMAAHFNVSQADEWAGKGDLRVGDRVFTAIRAFEERVLASLDGIVYISGFARAAAQERIPALASVPGEVVHGSVASRGGALASRPLLADLVTVGTLEPRKNQAYLLEVLAAAAELGHRYSLSVVGDGPERGRLEELARRLGLSDQVRFLGYTPDARSVMAQHRVYCHAATLESFGLVFVEAMAEGLPVLTGAVGGIPEIVRPGVDGDFWPLDDPAAAAGRLVALLEDPERLAATGRAARARAERDFGAAAAGDRLVAFLDAAAGRRAQPDRAA